MDEVRPNIAVTVVFIGTDPAWLRLPSGAVVESEEHPQYAGPASLCLALMIAGPSMTAVTTGIRVGRRESWFRVAQDSFAPDAWWLLFGVGLLGFVVQAAFPRPPLFLVLCGIGIAGLVLCYLIWLVLPIPSKGRHAPGRRRRRA